MTKERALLEETAEKHGEIKRRLAVIEEERTKLRIDSRRTGLSLLETERDQVVAENQFIHREKLELESRLSNQQSTLDTLRPGIAPAELTLHPHQHVPCPAPHRSSTRSCHSNVRASRPGITQAMVRSAPAIVFG